MRLLSGIESSALSILLDVRQPFAYLALHPAGALASELGIEINWLPFSVSPRTPPPPEKPDDDRRIRHRRYRAQAIAREIETYAGAQGLVLRDYYRDSDPALLNLGWLWLRDRHPDQLWSFLKEAFRAYWALELDSSDEAAVAALIDSVSGDGGEFRSWCLDDGPASASRLAAELRDRGLIGVPSYVVENEVFLGRQHLPMIRWILAGRGGPVPI